MHLPEVEALSQEDALKKLVPASAKKKCAFYRIWVRCALAAALSPCTLVHQAGVCLYRAPWYTRQVSVFTVSPGTPDRCLSLPCHLVH